MQMSKNLILKGLLALAVTYFLVQLIGFKIFIDKIEPKFDGSPWGVVKYFTDTCKSVQLPVFIVEPSLLRALRGGKTGLELWSRGKYSIITFGVVEPSSHELHELQTMMKSFHHLGINTQNPLDLTISSKQNYRTVPSHYFFWRTDVPMPVLHLVVLHRRGDYYWHSTTFNPQSAKPPLNASQLSLGKHAGALSRFSVKTEIIKGTELSFPADTSAFVWELQHSKFVECNFTQARHFAMTYGKKFMPEDPEFRRAVRQLLSLVLKTLNALEIPFWLSSGTLLGWFRQCDVIPYSKDMDIGILIADYREELTSALELAGLQLVHHFGKVSDSFELSFMYNNIKLDIFFFYEEGNHFWNGGTQASTGKKFKYSFPKFSVCWTEFLGLRVRVPDPALPYIEANYGKKWNIPVRDWDWKRSPPNVVGNGEWPLAERDQVIQLFEVEKQDKLPR